MGILVRGEGRDLHPGIGSIAGGVNSGYLIILGLLLLPLLGLRQLWMRPWAVCGSPCPPRLQAQDVWRVLCSEPLVWPGAWHRGAVDPVSPVITNSQLITWSEYSQCSVNIYGGNRHYSSLAVFPGPLPWPSFSAPWWSFSSVGPLALPGHDWLLSTDYLLVLQLSRSILYLSCLHSR